MDSRKSSEVFVVEKDRKIALFAPMRGLVMEIDSGEKLEVERLLSRPDFSFEMLLKVFPEIDPDQLTSPVAEELVVESMDDFRPTGAVLFPTFNCGLRCVYCYSSAGINTANMDEDVSKAAVDFVIANALTTKRDECSLEFHGGGEPTFNWKVFSFTLEYFQARARSLGLKSKVAISTNGMLSEAYANWLADHLSIVQVSIDGTADIQNAQRPTLSGSKSYDTVKRTIEILLSKKVEVVLHSVVTELGMTKIPEIVSSLCENFPGVKTIHLEPAFSCGRGLLTGQKFPSVHAFVGGFIEADGIAKLHGIELFYSGAGPNITRYHSSFCGAVTPNFIVSPTGLVTACNEVSDLSHSQAGHFIYGSFNRDSQRFEFDYGRILTLRRSRTKMQTDSNCSECFARFYCAGDCLAKHQHTEGGEVSSLNPRCVLNRELLRHYIFQRLT